MSEAPSDDEDLGPTVPEPPRRVPFGVAATAALLGVVSVLLLIGAVGSLSSGSYLEDGVGVAAAEGLLTAAVAVAAAVVAAVAWSFTRNGNTVGPLVVGLLLLLAGLISLVVGVVSAGDTDGVRVGLLALALGLGIVLTPMLGHGPSYLAARRVWSQAEGDWLEELATPMPPAPQHQQQWPGHYPPQPGQWGQQPQWGQPPGYPQPQYQYPAPQWPAQPVPASAPPAAGAPQTPFPMVQPSVPQAPVPPPAAAQQAPTEQVVPPAAAQQAPTEMVRQPPPPEPPV